MTTQLNSSRHEPPPVVSSGPDLTAQAISRHLQRGRYLRSEAIYRRIGDTIGVLAGTYRDFREGLKRRNAKHAAVTELSRLNNHMLADIGIRRAQIPMVVEAMIARRATTPEPGPRVTDVRAVSTASGLACGCGAANDEGYPSLAA